MSLIQRRETGREDRCERARLRERQRVEGSEEEAPPGGAVEGRHKSWPSLAPGFLQRFASIPPTPLQLGALRLQPFDTGAGRLREPGPGVRPVFSPADEAVPAIYSAYGRRPRRTPSSTTYAPRIIRSRQGKSPSPISNLRCTLRRCVTLPLLSMASSTGRPTVRDAADAVASRSSTWSMRDCSSSLTQKATSRTICRS